jgi:cytochrome P450
MTESSTPVEVDDDLLAAEASADPYALFAQLREHDPVQWSVRHRAWLLTRYDDVSSAFQNRAQSNDRVRPLPGQRISAMGEQITALVDELEPSLASRSLEELRVEVAR